MALHFRRDTLVWEPFRTDDRTDGITGSRTDANGMPHGRTDGMTDTIPFHFVFFKSYVMIPEPPLGSHTGMGRTPKDLSSRV